MRKTRNNKNVYSNKIKYEKRKKEKEKNYSGLVLHLPTCKVG